MRAGVAPEGSERIQQSRTSIRQDRPIEDGAGLATKSRGESVEASRGVEGAVLLGRLLRLLSGYGRDSHGAVANTASSFLRQTVILNDDCPEIRYNYRFRTGKKLRNLSERVA